MAGLLFSAKPLPELTMTIINYILKNKFQWHFNQNTNIFIQENAFGNIVCKTVAILSWPQCVDGNDLDGMVGCQYISFQLHYQGDKPYKITQQQAYPRHPNINVDTNRATIMMLKLCVLTQHCGYWCPGATAPGHQHPQYWYSLYWTSFIPECNHYTWSEKHWEIRLHFEKKTTVVYGLKL